MTPDMDPHMLHSYQRSIHAMAICFFKGGSDQGCRALSSKMQMPCKPHERAWASDMQGSMPSTPVACSFRLPVLLEGQSRMPPCCSLGEPHDTCLVWFRGAECSK